jgi:hypothetical protein
MWPVERSAKNAKQQTTPKRKPGGQPGNRNAWQHGERSARAVLQRRLIRAEIRALARIAIAAELLAVSDVRLRPVRADQLRLLKAFRPSIAGLLDWALHQTRSRSENRRKRF